MEIKREHYLNKLISAKGNGLIKIITGIKYVGKSYLLNNIFYNYLKSEGVDDNHIIKVALDNDDFSNLLDSSELNKYIKERLIDDKTYYVLLDEIQLVDGFEFVLNGLLYKQNVDVYVTGSNSKFLSSDIITEFRGRGDEIRVFPLTFSEFVSIYEGSNSEAWEEYINYGGMPQVVLEKDTDKKANLLKNLFDNVYINDIIQRYDLKEDNYIGDVINILASSVGSLTNPLKLSNTFQSNGIKDVNNKKVSNYLNYLLDSFLIEKVQRYDIKGKKYINTPIKYYFVDVGLRNARLNFRQGEENHLMENIVYNELLYRGYNVDVGVVEINEKNGKGVSERKQIEIDFVCNQGSKRYYIQCALNIDTREKNYQESRPLNAIGDNFKKIILVKDNIIKWYNEDGILIMGIKEFLLNKDSINY